MNEKKYKRIFTVVIDSLGAGEMPDAASYGDAGTDTLGHIAANVEEFKIQVCRNIFLTFPILQAFQPVH